MESSFFGQPEVDFVRRRRRDAQVPRWATDLISVHQFPDESHLSSGTATSPGLVPSSLAPPSPSFSPCLPMWPSSRRPWPSSVGLCCCWDVGTQRVPSRECGCKNLSRGRWEGANQRPRSRPGSWGGGPVRCTKARGRGGRTSPLPRSGVGSGHDTCLPLDSGRRSQAAHSHHEWSPPRGCQTTEGGVLPRTGWQWRQARLVVLAGEVGGRFSDETAQFLRGLASAKVPDVPQILQGRAHAAWMRRWSSILACAAARAFALSLLDRDCSTGVDGHTPSVHEVLGDSRHVE